MLVAPPSVFCPLRCCSEPNWRTKRTAAMGTPRERTQAERRTKAEWTARSYREGKKRAGKTRAGAGNVPPKSLYMVLQWAPSADTSLRLGASNAVWSEKQQVMSKTLFPFLLCSFWATWFWKPNICCITSLCICTPGEPAHQLEKLGQEGVSNQATVASRCTQLCLPLLAFLVLILVLGRWLALGYLICLTHVLGFLVNPFLPWNDMFVWW